MAPPVTATTTTNTVYFKVPPCPRKPPGHPATSADASPPREQKFFTFTLKRALFLHAIGYSPPACEHRRGSRIRRRRRDATVKTRTREAAGVTAPLAPPAPLAPAPRPATRTTRASGSIRPATFARSRTRPTCSRTTRSRERSSSTVTARSSPAPASRPRTGPCRSSNYAPAIMCGWRAAARARLHVGRVQFLGRAGAIRPP